ncbi:MAG: hypothetical protein ACR2FG_02360 [Marmoricola sp.]
MRQFERQYCRPCSVRVTRGVESASATPPPSASPTPTPTPTTGAVAYSDADLQKALTPRSAINGYKITSECRDMSDSCARVQGNRGVALRGLATPSRQAVPQLVYVGIYRTPSRDAAFAGIAKARRAALPSTGSFNLAPGRGLTGLNLRERGRASLVAAHVKDWRGLLHRGSERFVAAGGRATAPQRFATVFLFKGRYFISVSVTRWADVKGTSAYGGMSNLVTNVVQRLDG